MSVFATRGVMEATWESTRPYDPITDSFVFTLLIGHEPIFLRLNPECTLRLADSLMEMLRRRAAGYACSSSIFNRPPFVVEGIVEGDYLVPQLRQPVSVDGDGDILLAVGRNHEKGRVEYREPRFKLPRADFERVDLVERFAVEPLDGEAAALAGHDQSPLRGESSLHDSTADRGATPSAAAPSSGKGENFAGRVAA
jgi:hypothetical protein